mmetsp:Transcript_2964/g.6497  ORF Transcript_2964/g.6497 Transcript_2964/m.6497 type:complete len:216 (-) Transcript_2964:2035-2682(-)
MPSIILRASGDILDTYMDPDLASGNCSVIFTIIGNIIIRWALPPIIDIARDATSICQPVHNIRDALLELQSVCRHLHWRRKSRSVLRISGQGCAEQVHKGSIHLLLPALVHGVPHLAGQMHLQHAVVLIIQVEAKLDEKNDELRCSREMARDCAKSALYVLNGLCQLHYLLECERQQSVEMSEWGWVPVLESNQQPLLNDSVLLRSVCQVGPQLL